MQVTVNTEKLSLIVEVDGRQYRYADKIHNATELEYIENRLKWFDTNNKLSACLTAEFSPL